MAPPVAPVSNIVVKLTARCNLGCTYCYWFRDASVYETPPRMTEEVEEAFLRRLEEHLSRYRIATMGLGLHGGEPLLFGKRRFERLLRRLRDIEEASGTALALNVTTNGVLVDAEWAAMFRRHGVLVGVSIDGPPAIHDSRRVDLLGRPSHVQVIEGLCHLVREGLDPGVLAVCDPLSDPAELMTYFVDVLGLTNFDVLVPDARHGDQPASIARYYTGLFDLWFDRYADRGVRVRWLEAAVRGLLGGWSGVDSIGYGPITIVTLLTDGSIQVQDVCRIAGDGSIVSPVNVLSHPLEAIHDDPLWREVWDASINLAEPCRGCKWLHACGGGHIASRWSDERRFDNPSVYCEDFKTILSHYWRRVEPTLYYEPIPATPVP
ncbi:MAG TPA: radical SAM protein [Acidimicrobiales bacterium]